MPQFSERSKAKLETCDPRLQRLANAVIEVFDCTVVDGHRGEEKQNDLYERGLSKVRYPNSEHNIYPSKAIDLAPFDPFLGRINWNDTLTFYYFAGIVMGIAVEQGLLLRWGGDWDMDDDLDDQTFVDLAHFEIVETLEV
jgi:peptidoglycan L-alanyl-D-glutamate endopeptidase CwlK